MGTAVLLGINLAALVIVCVLKLTGPSENNLPVHQAESKATAQENIPESKIGQTLSLTERQAPNQGQHDEKQTEK